jgi:hypothetical protein
MNMIVHQTIGPNSDGLFNASLNEHLDIDVPIPIVQEDVRFPIAALRDMVWISWQGNST